MEIAYQVIGQGYPLVCLHGNGEDHHIYDEFAEDFKDKYQLILIDSRYHGESIHQGKLSYQQMKEDTLLIIDELGLDNYDVIGFSDGAIISMLLALEDERLKHMILIGGNVEPNGIKLIYRITFLFQMLCFIPFFYRKVARLQFKLYMLMFKEPHISLNDLMSIKVPTLVMCGEFDMIKESHTRSIQNALKYSALKIIKGGNHFLLRDSYDLTKKEINLFLEACHQEDEL